MNERYKSLVQQAEDIATSARELDEPCVETIRRLEELGKLVDQLRSGIAQERGGTMAAVVEQGMSQADLADNLGVSSAAVSKAIAGRARSRHEVTREALEILRSHLGDSPVQVSAWMAAWGLVDSTKRSDRLAVARRVQQITRNLQPAQLKELASQDRHTVMLAAGFAAELLSPTTPSGAELIER